MRMTSTPKSITAPHPDSSTQRSFPQVLPVSPLQCWQGAEARVTVFEYAPGVNAIHKLRLSKAYRHPLLDARLLKQRLTQEVRCTHRIRCLAGRQHIRVPAILGVFNECVVMEYIRDGITVKDFLKQNDGLLSSAQLMLLLQVLGEATGRAIGEMHNVDVVHGDLTTSNLLLNPQDTRLQVGVLESGAREGDSTDSLSSSSSTLVTLIDFGLAQVSRMVEDRAVDLYVLERALLSTHSKYAEALMQDVWRGYKAVNGDAEEVLAKYEEVRMRGRKRTMVG